MATVDQYKIQVDVQGQDKVKNLSSSISGLGAAIAGIGFASFIHGVLEMADAISDLSDATGLAIKDIIGFQQGLAAAGGKAGDAGKMIAKFYQSIDQAASGSESAQKALERVGISFADLGALSEKDLLSKALKTLSEMPAGAERTAAAIEVLGKSFRSIDPKILEEALRSGDFSQVEESIKKAGEMADKLAANFMTLQLAGASAFDTITSSLEPFIGKVEKGRLSLEQAQSIIKGVGIALAITFGAKAVGTIIEIVGAIVTLNKALKATAVVQTALQALQGPKGWAILAGGAVAAAAAVYGLNKALEETPDTAVTPKPGEAPTTPAAAAGPARKTQFYSDAELQARKQALTAAKETTSQLNLQNKAAQDYQRILNTTIGMDEYQGSIIKLNAGLEQDANNKILDLNKQIEVEKSKGRGTNQGIITELGKQKQQVIDNLATTKQLKQEELSRLDIIKQQVANQQLIGQFLITDNKNSQDASANRIRMGVAVGRLTEEEGQKRLELDNAHYENINKLNALQIQMNQQKMQGLNNEAARTQELIYDEKQRNTDAIANITQRYDIEKAKRNSNTAGAVAALETIKSAMTPFAVAQQSTAALFNNMNSALDNFVETGKLKFGDFASSVIKDLLKIQLKAAATKLLSSALGGSWLGSLIGLAEGGPTTAGTPYIVGEQGPELFVPKAAGTIIPNKPVTGAGAGTVIPNGMGGGQSVVNNYITNNNVSAIDAKSVAQFFAENRKTMLGSVELARKELPYGNR